MRHHLADHLWTPSQDVICKVYTLFLANFNIIRIREPYLALTPKLMSDSLQELLDHVRPQDTHRCPARLMVCQREVKRDITLGPVRRVSRVWRVRVRGQVDGRLYDQGEGASHRNVGEKGDGDGRTRIYKRTTTTVGKGSLELGAGADLP
jgi:hypothetical protein